MSIEKHDWMQAWVSLIHAGSHLRHGLESELREHLGISLAEQDLIRQLGVNSGQLTLSELGKRIYFSKAGMTRMLDRLEADGLVERRSVEGDRRALTAVLTSRGEQTLKRSRKIIEAYARANLRDRLDDQEIIDLKRCLELLLEAHGVWKGQQRHLEGKPGSGS